MLKKSCLKVQNLQYKFLDWKWPPLEIFWKIVCFGTKKISIFSSFSRMLCLSVFLSCFILTSGLSTKTQSETLEKKQMYPPKLYQGLKIHSRPRMPMAGFCPCDDDVELSLWWWCRIVLTKRKPGARVTQDALHCIAGSGRRHFLRAPRTFSRLCSTFFRERALIRTLFMFGLGCMVGVQK